MWLGEQGGGWREVGLQGVVRPDSAGLRGCDADFESYCKSFEKPAENAGVRAPPAATWRIIWGVAKIVARGPERN